MRQAKEIVDRRAYRCRWTGIAMLAAPGGGITPHAAGPSRTLRCSLCSAEDVR
jgi:hypothetical protein